MGKISVVTVAKAHLSSALRPENQPTAVSLDVSSLAQSCIKYARKMLRLFEDLHTTGNITGFSFTDFQGCSTATIVLLVAAFVPGRHNFQSTASAGLGYLRLMAGKNAAALRGVQFVEAVQAVVNEATAKVAVKTQSSDFTSNVQASESSNYVKWTQWLTTTNLPESRFATQGTDMEHTQGGQAETFVPPTPASASGLDPLCWDYAASTQTSPGTTPLNRFGNAAMPGHLAGAPYDDSMMTPDLPSAFGNDHDFLMGLTGLGVLDFTEQADLGLDFGISGQ
jgi:hypothetical protein